MNFEVAIPYIATFGLVAVRIGAMFALLPFFGGQSVPAGMRAGSAVVFSLALASVIGPTTLDSAWAVITSGLGELITGLAIGVVVRLAMVAADFAGEVAGMQMGFAFNRIVDPLTQETAAVPSRFLNLIALMLFWAIDGHHVVLAALATSLQTVPPGEFLPRVSLGTAMPLLSLVTSVGLRMAAPVVIALLLTNVALGVLSRAAPKLQLFAMSFGFSIGIGMLMLMASAWPSLTLFVDHLRRIPDFIAAVLGV